MLVLISGSNRPGCMTAHVATVVREALEQSGREVHWIDLRELPEDLFRPASYKEKPAAFEAHQEAILAAQGIVTVVPEYNGSFPGALKYFIDLLRFPESLVDVPAGFVGVAAGEWGGLRAVEQLEKVFQYRHAHPYGRRVFVKKVYDVVDPASGGVKDEALVTRLRAFAEGFASFAERVKA